MGSTALTLAAWFGRGEIEKRQALILVRRAASAVTIRGKSALKANHWRPAL
jgi:hypothetical protein